jgi:ribonuclease P/MRP protein subunit POP3
VNPSKGKRSKKRKRKEVQAATQAIREVPASREGEANLTTPSIPPIQLHITIGLNSTSEYLDKMISSHSLNETVLPPESTPSEPTAQLKPLATIFLTTVAMIHLPYSHIPTLTSLASGMHPNAPPIRLVHVGASSETKLSETLGIPRVGMIGVLEGAPGAKPLIEYVRDTVEAIDVPWTREVGAGRWLGTKIIEGKENRELDGKS